MVSLGLPQWRFPAVSIKRILAIARTLLLRMRRMLLDGQAYALDLAA